MPASDRQVFFAAREALACVMTKDADFLRLLELHGPPPSVLWITCGNTSNAHLKRIPGASLGRALEMIRAGEPPVEISDHA